MSSRQIVAGFLALSVLMSSPAFTWRADGQAAPPVPAGAQAPAESGESAEVTPPRVSYIYGEVSFWRPGAEDWAPARVNTPLAPGDVLYSGSGGNVEIQVGPRAFVRAAEETQMGLDNQEPDFLQLRVTGGHAALDVRELAAGQTVELGTPNAVFTVERTGFYRVGVGPDSTTFATYRGGMATMTAAGGAPTQIAANQQVVITGTEASRVEMAAAPQLTAWDRWNYERTNYLLQSTSARNVPPAVYGAEALEQHGSWRTVETYGAVWVPASVSPGWVPYSAGRWIWDPRFGWTWLDDAPWGWAPYHYGRWVFVGSYWAWAPGPVVVRPVYSPALVVFLGGGVRVGIGVRPLCWAPLGWGEPVIPWWGRRGFVGVASWHGWGGPRVVNNVVVTRSTTVNVTNINVYRNVTVTNAVVGVSADRFGQHQDRPRRIDQAEVRQLTPVRGPLDVKPVAASVTVASGPAAKPPVAMQSRAVVATRPPHDPSSRLGAEGLAPGRAAEPTPAPRIVPSPRSVRGTDHPTVSNGGQRQDRQERGERRERSQPQTTPAPSSQPASPQSPARSEPPAVRGERQERPQAPASERPGPLTPPERGERRSQPQTTPAPSSQPASPQPPARSEPPAVRGERQERPQAPVSPRQPPSARSEPPAVRGDRQERPQAPAPERPATAAPPERGERRGQPQTTPAPSPPPAPPPASPRQPPAARSEPPAVRGERQERPQAPAPERPAPVAPPERGDRQDRGPRQERTDRQERNER